MAKRWIPLTVAGLVLAGGLVVVGSSMSGGVYSLTLEEALTAADRIGDREFKVSGNVKEGSVRKGQNAFETRFDIGDGTGRTLSCVYQGALPDPFAEGREVILQGRMDGAGTMRVGRMIVKCPSKYQEAGVSEEQAEEYYREKYRGGHRKEP
ncbi:cytochrome c maturation protein CcmE [Myxococcota bacterium]|nr:cytochrome c maturation protein CcmE [Myxococcota bacterium]